MKPIFLFTLLFYFQVCLSQKNNPFYAGAFGGYVTINKPSAGVFGGYNINQYIGAGGGIEMLGMDQLESKKLNPSFPLFGEIRFSIPGKVVKPSLALQGGKYIYTSKAAISSLPDFEIDYQNKGKTFFGGTLIFTFPGKNDRSGFFAGYNFRAVKFEQNVMLSNFRNPVTGVIEPAPRISNTSTIFEVYLHVIVVGYSF